MPGRWQLIKITETRKTAIIKNPRDTTIIEHRSPGARAIEGPQMLRGQPINVIWHVRPGMG